MYQVIENAGYEQQSLVGEFVTYAEAIAFQFEQYTIDELHELHVEIALDYNYEF